MEFLRGAATPSAYHDWEGWYGFDRGYRLGLGDMDGVGDMGHVGKGRYGCGWGIWHIF